MAYRPKFQTVVWEVWRVERKAGSAILRYVRKYHVWHKANIAVPPEM